MMGTCLSAGAGGLGKGAPGGSRELRGGPSVLWVSRSSWALVCLAPALSAFPSVSAFYSPWFLSLPLSCSLSVFVPAVLRVFLLSVCSLWGFLCLCLSRFLPVSVHLSVPSPSTSPLRRTAWPGWRGEKAGAQPLRRCWAPTGSRGARACQGVAGPPAWRTWRLPPTGCGWVAEISFTALVD